MANLGDQASWILRDRQRKVWNELKFVPGCVVEGTFNPHSLGEPLVYRYLWYLKHVESEKTKPDKVEMDVEKFRTLLPLYLASKGYTRDSVSLYLPMDHFEGVQPSQTAYQSQVLHDPRLVNGMTTLQALEMIIKQDRFRSYRDWKESHAEGNSLVASTPHRVDGGCHPSSKKESSVHKRWTHELVTGHQSPVQWVLLQVSGQ